MKQKFSVAQINSIVKKHLAGATIEQLCQEYKISVATFYRWKANYLDINEQILTRLDKLEQENLALKQMMCAEKTGGFNLVNYRHSSGVYHEQETEDLHRRI